jgi:hypothetical protein
MRDSGLRSVGLAIFLVGCTASGSDAERHGPDFDPAVADGGGAGASDAAADTAVATDARVDAAAAPLDAAIAADASDTSAPVDSGARCTATTVLLAGGGAGASGAHATGVGAFVADAVATTVTSAPALVAHGAGFQAMLRTSGNGLASLAYDATWGAPSSFPAAGALASPALATVGSTLHVAYLGTNNRYYHGTFSGAAWDAASDPVGHVADGGVQAFGPTAASAAGVPGALVVAYAGDDHHVYTHGWTAAAGWTDGVAVAPDLAYADAAPALVALDAGASDLAVVFAAADTTVRAAQRSATSKAWSAPAPIDATALTRDGIRVASIPGGRAVAVYRGTDGKPYGTTYDPARATPWSSPAPLAGVGNPAVLSVPAVAAGVCGDDAVAAFVDSSGIVSVVALRGTAWASRGPVSGIAGATYVSIATRP